MTMSAAITSWRAGRTVAQLREAGGETLMIENFAYRISPLPGLAAGPLVVLIEVIGAGDRVLAEARVEVSDA